MPKAAKKTALADQLLDLHVRHELARLTPEQALTDITHEVETLFTTLGPTPLKELVSLDTVLGIIQRNVIELEIPGAIPDLAGELARTLYDSPEHLNARLCDLIERRHVEAFVDEAVSLREHRNKMITHVLDHPIYAELVSNILYHGITNYIYEDNLISKKVPGVASMLKVGTKMLNKAVSGLDTAVEKNLKGYIARNIEFIVRTSQQFLTEHLTDEQLHESVMDVWAAVEREPLSRLQEGLGVLELSEFIVLGYEFWLSFRKTPYFADAVRTVVSGFYARYGDNPVIDLLNELEITPAQVMVEIGACLPDALAALHACGYLEDVLRRRLAPFYASDAVTALLH